VAIKRLSDQCLCKKCLDYWICTIKKQFTMFSGKRATPIEEARVICRMPNAEI
jgi:hypothetical protein